MLEKMIVGFADYLRQSKLSLPTSSVQEAMHVLPYINIHKREHMHLILRQLWIKDKELQVLFDECFQEYFYQQFYDIAHEMSQKRRLEISKQKMNSLKEKKMNQDNKNASHHTSVEWLTAHLEQKKGTVAELFLAELNHALSKEFNKVSKSLEELSPKDINDFSEELTWDACIHNQPSVVFDSIETLRSSLLKIRNAVNKIKREELDVLSGIEKNQHSGMRKMVQTEIDCLKERPIAQLKKDEILRLREHIERHSLALFTKFSKLMKQSNAEMEIDMKRTISGSLQTFGVPIRLMYRDLKRKKTKLEVIMDVSGSVIKSAEFLTLFSYLIHQQFPGQVRIFNFVGKLAETTDFFHTEDIEAAIHHVLKRANIDYRGYSNYDMAFRIYEDEFLTHVDDDTIVFILGDARNNRNQAREKTVQTIHAQAKAVFWLNPEERVKWNTGDSVIRKYQLHCTNTFCVTSVNQLLYALEEIAEMMETTK